MAFVKSDVKRRDEYGTRMQAFGQRQDEVVEIEGQDGSDATLKMGLSALKSGRSAKDYPNNDAGLELLKQRTYEYVQRVIDVNESKEGTKRLLLDVEGWAIFCGTTRKTLLDWQNGRGEKWKEFILLTKEMITATKKARAFAFQTPAAFSIFDLKNNAGYSDSAELTLIAKDERTELQQAEDVLTEKGLVWDDEQGRYVPAK